MGDSEGGFTAEFVDGIVGVAVGVVVLSCSIVVGLQGSVILVLKLWNYTWFRSHY